MREPGICIGQTSEMTVITCDFDGTIIQQDSALLALQTFGEGNWQIFDDQLEAGKISLEECMQQQFATIKTPVSTILATIMPQLQARKYVDTFFRFQYTSPKISTIRIVSAGLDFLIEEFLKQHNLKIDITAIKTDTSAIETDGIQLKFDESAAQGNFKSSLIAQYQTEGYTVFHVGDGSSDYEAAQQADFVFCLEGSSLERFCQKHELHYFSFAHFGQVVKYLVDQNYLKQS